MESSLGKLFSSPDICYAATICSNRCFNLLMHIMMLIKFVHSFGLGQFRESDVTKNNMWAGALVNWLRKETHIRKVVSSNPSTGSRGKHFTLICSKIVVFVLKDQK